MKDIPIGRVAAGQEHSIFLNAKGDSVYACGHGNYGQLGIPKEELEFKKDGQVSDKQAVRFCRFPRRVAFPKTDRLDKIGRFVDIFCGDNHTCVITTAGKIYSFGYGEYGQCGNDPRVYTTDISRARLNDDWLKDCDLCVYQGSGGSQHTLIVASRHKKTV